jgi:hypothetical protein
MKTSRPNVREVGSSGNGLVVYEDLQVNIGRIRLGSSAPAWRSYNHGTANSYDVLGFEVGESILFDIQTKHAMALNTPLDCHIHFILPNTTNVGDKFQFQLDVIGAAINAQYAVLAGSPFTAEHTIAANDDTYHRLLDIADFPAINSTVSTIYSVELTRIAATANEYGSEVYLKFVDCHAKNDTLGSLQEDSKI